jgi:hypothetical protein
MNYVPAIPAPVPVLSRKEWKRLVEECKPSQPEEPDPKRQRFESPLSVPKRRANLATYQSCYGTMMVACQSGPTPSALAKILEKKKQLKAKKEQLQQELKSLREQVVSQVPNSNLDQAKPYGDILEVTNRRWKTHLDDRGPFGAMEKHGKYTKPATCVSPENMSDLMIILNLKPTWVDMKDLYSAPGNSKVLAEIVGQRWPHYVEKFKEWENDVQ